LSSNNNTKSKYKIRRNWVSSQMIKIQKNSNDKTDIVDV
jgi:hypothetical protein